MSMLHKDTLPVQVSDLRTVGPVLAQETALMKVSIITVTLNSARYLEDCIRSVQEQDYKHIEHIIIDGKSTDGTVSIIQQYEEGIACWVSETDKGMYDAINKGMQLATGEVVGILNSDDVLDNRHVIFDIVKTFLAKKTDAVYGDLDFVDKEDTNHVLRSWKGKVYHRARFHLGWMPAHPTFYVKRKLIEQFGGYETHYFTAADYEFMCRYLFQHHVKAEYIPKRFVRMRVGGASSVSLKQRLRANRRDYLAMKRNGIPLAFIASVLKPLLKIGQFKRKRENGRIRFF